MMVKAPSSFRGLTAEFTAAIPRLDRGECFWIPRSNRGMTRRLSRNLTGILAIILLFFVTSSHAFTENPYPFTTTTQEKRFESLTKTIRCVVCQNQSIADSNAPLANDLRNKVYKLILDDKSDTYIQEYLVKRYGEFILLQPRMNKLTFILWVFPFFALGIVLIILIKIFSRRRL